jgi:hypothetical protein
MDALKLQYQELSPLKVQTRAQRLPEGPDFLVDDYNEDARLSHEEVWTRAHKGLIEHYGEEARVLLNQERAKRGWELL